MLNETINILNDLNLYGLKNSISSEIDYITNNNLSFLEGLNHFLKNEVKYREINRAEANIKVAHFPYLKEIKDFDFDYQPSINKDVINENPNLNTNKNNLELHGFGIKSIKRIAKKYNGFADFYQEKNIFYCVVKLPINH